MVKNAFARKQIISGIESFFQIYTSTHASCPSCAKVFQEFELYFFVRDKNGLVLAIYCNENCHHQHTG
jgi:hypothetical protein